MINDINLIPDKILYRNQRILLNAAKIAAVAMVAAVVLYGVLFIRLERRDMEKQVAEVTSQIDNSALKALSDAQNQLTAKQTEKKELDEILKGVPVDRIKMTELLDRITKLMPATIKAENIKYTSAQGELELSLAGKSRTDISLFLKLLHDDDLFLDINVTPITGRESPFRFTVVLDMAHEEKTEKQ